jgi:hypothetical protein
MYVSLVGAQEGCDDGSLEGGNVGLEDGCDDGSLEGGNVGLEDGDLEALHCQHSVALHCQPSIVRPVLLATFSVARLGRPSLISFYGVMLGNSKNEQSVKDRSLQD